MQANICNNNSISDITTTKKSAYAKGQEGEESESARFKGQAKPEGGQK